MRKVNRAMISVSRTRCSAKRVEDARERAYGGAPLIRDPGFFLSCDFG
jgi:hypothetical protein